jgi:hypothetical protein
VVLKYFQGLNRIVAIYEPADPLLNGHNINLLFQDSSSALLEIVGPGFDASDLQRGNLSPHEVYSAGVSQDGEDHRLRLIFRIDPHGFLKSKLQRERKLRRRLREAPTQRLASLIAEDLQRPRELNALLRSINSPLSGATQYTPIDLSLLKTTISAVMESGLISKYNRLTGSGFPINISTSRVNLGAMQVFWDVVSPSLKYQGLSAALT